MHSVDSKYVRKFMKWQAHVWFTIMIHRFHCTYSDTQVSLHLLWYKGFTALTPIHTYHWHCTYSDKQVSLHLLQYTGFTALTLTPRFLLHLLQYTGFTAPTPINMFYCTYSHTQVSLHLLQLLPGQTMYRSWWSSAQLRCWSFPPWTAHHTHHWNGCKQLQNRA